MLVASYSIEQSKIGRKRLLYKLFLTVSLPLEAHLRLLIDPNTFSNQFNGVRPLAEQQVKNR